MCVNCSQKSAYQKPCCKSAPKFTVSQHAQPAFPSVIKHFFFGMRVASNFVGLVIKRNRDHLARLQLAAMTTYYLGWLTAILAALMHVAKIATLLSASPRKCPRGQFAVVRNLHSFRRPGSCPTTISCLGRSSDSSLNKIGPGPWQPWHYWFSLPSRFSQAVHSRSLCRLRETGDRESVWAFASFRIFKSLAKFRVELVDIGQESVECTLRPEIGQHVFVAHEAQREGPGPFFHHHEHEDWYLFRRLKLRFITSGWATPAAAPAENGCNIASVLV